VSETPDMSWKKADLLEHAETTGVEADSSMTKQQIIDAITGGNDDPGYDSVTGITEYSPEYYALGWAERTAVSKRLHPEDF
jgi:hypothetical protein